MGIATPTSSVGLERNRVHEVLNALLGRGMVVADNKVEPPVIYIPGADKAGTTSQQQAQQTASEMPSYKGESDRTDGAPDDVLMPDEEAVE
jgi:hypothetical protein